MNFSRFEPFATYDDDRPSRLILFPHTSYESICREEWFGREAEWIRIANILHWTLSYLGDPSRSNILLLQPESEDIARNLAAHVPANQIQEISGVADGGDQAIVDLLAVRDRLEELRQSSFDLILVTGLFGRGATAADERALLRAGRDVLKPGGMLLATFPLRDATGNALTARNIQFVDATGHAGFQQIEVLGCQGIAEYLDHAFWDRLRSQGHAAFDAVFNALGPLTDSPATLWMSSEALYIGNKV